MTKQELRNKLRDQFGPRQYRLMSDGDIHVYGRMPNSAEVGWWLYGSWSGKGNYVQADTFHGEYA